MEQGQLPAWNGDKKTSRTLLHLQVISILFFFFCRPHPKVFLVFGLKKSKDINKEGCPEEEKRFGKIMFLNII